VAIDASRSHPLVVPARHLVQRIRALHGILAPTGAVLIAEKLDLPWQDGPQARAVRPIARAMIGGPRARQGFAITTECCDGAFLP
jgi:hypothetical protein